eukprot:scaffold122032_cov45-Phaeocystis_antarctica.AAC.2
MVGAPTPSYTRRASLPGLPGRGRNVGGGHGAMALGAPRVRRSSSISVLPSLPSGSIPGGCFGRDVRHTQASNPGLALTRTSRPNPNPKGVCHAGRAPGRAPGRPAAHKCGPRRGQARFGRREDPNPNPNPDPNQARFGRREDALGGREDVRYRR